MVALVAEDGDEADYEGVTLPMKARALVRRYDIFRHARQRAMPQRQFSTQAIYRGAFRSRESPLMLCIYRRLLLRAIDAPP